jgi:hypothetical protein
LFLIIIRIFDNKFNKLKEKSTLEAPWNFSWVVGGKLAAFACPGSVANLNFLCEQGVTHLVTLSRTHKPSPAALKEFPDLCWTLIDVEEFEPPTLQQMQQFIQICDQALANLQVNNRSGVDVNFTFG